MSANPRFEQNARNQHGTRTVASTSTGAVDDVCERVYDLRRNADLPDTHTHTQKEDRNLYPLPPAVWPCP